MAGSMPILHGLWRTGFSDGRFEGHDIFHGANLFGLKKKKSH